MNTLQERLCQAVNRQRLVETALELCAVHSPTGKAGGAADCLAEILQRDGFWIDTSSGLGIGRPTAGHPASPAVEVRYGTGIPGPVLQFNGHLDTVHLPFVSPRAEGERLLGTGVCDMKGGVAAAVEALRAIRETSALERGSILFTAHDLHEAPWGFGQQLDELIRTGIHGDAVLIPEPMCDKLPVVGRGAATWKLNIRRSGPPIHEVIRPLDEPSVITTGAKLVARLAERQNHLLSAKTDPLAGSESVFIGQIHSGEIYNQYPQECWLEGTRRWLPATNRADVEREFRAELSDLAKKTGTSIDCDFRFIRDAFYLDQQHPIVAAFQEANTVLSGKPLPTGPKPFVDDGNSFWGLAKIPAITHGAKAGGQHTVNEWVEIDDLVRVARVYALTAAAFCK